MAKKEKPASNYLPLSEATYYIMLALFEPMHGYGVMQMVEEINGGDVTIGPGTLYGALSSLESEKLIEMVREEGRRKVYTLTEAGKAVFKAQQARLALMARLGEDAIKQAKEQL
jgi:DNA-binding PadR family transcriptional regulator